jgi:N6-adenosine-specific RNA methylase IME4
MDPPWPNKSVTRANAYDTIDRRCLLYLPVTKLLSPTGLVAVWVTNKIAHIQFVRRSLFKAWGLTEVAEWWWIKVTSSGHHVVEPGCLHRHPYEILLIGRRPTRGGEAKTSHRALVCPPIKQHSRKPPLTGLFLIIQARFPIF